MKIGFDFGMTNSTISFFYAVETIVRQFFGSDSGYIDKRFEQPFPELNRSFAISRGAALIAQQDRYFVEHVCPYSIGYVTYRIKMDSHEPVDHTIVKKGAKISEFRTAVYSKVSIKIANKSVGYLRIFFDDGRAGGVGRRQLKLQEQLSELFPAIDGDNEYKIGFSLNKNTVPTLHIVDKNGREVKTSLFKLYEKLSIVEK